MAAPSLPSFGPPPNPQTFTPFGHWCPRDPQRKDLQPNTFNALMDCEAGLWQDIVNGIVTQGYGGNRYPDAPWQVMPPDGRRLNEVNAIPLPAADDGDHLVHSFLVPEGMDGCAATIVTAYTGDLAASPGYIEGSGDLVFRVQINERWVMNWGNMVVTQGNIKNPWDNNSGLVLLQSRQTVSLWVFRTAASAGNFTLGNIIMGMYGWYWPR